MHNTVKMTSDMYYIGANDRRLALFESVFPIPRGVSYNSYLVDDEKTVLLDTVDRAVSGVFFDNIRSILGSRPLDYLIVNHMEPDHCAMIADIARMYPEVTIVANGKAAAMIKRFFDFELDSRLLTVAEGDTLVTGRHTFTFVMTPMVHWPEVMMTYDITDKVLYSADAFGTFGALSGNLYADEVEFDRDWMPDARRYYTNIVGKYGNQVMAALKKASTVEISLLCPLHGPIWRKNIDKFVEKYAKWATYTPEENAVLIAYASIYGDTQNAAEILARHLSARGVRNIAMYDVSVTHPSVIVSEAFRASHLVFCSPTYNAGIFINMETVLLDIAAHNLQNRYVAFVENGSWAPTAGKLMRGIIEPLKNMTIVGDIVTVESSVKPEKEDELSRLADAIVDSMPKPEVISHESKIDKSAFFKLSYGLFVLTARDGEKDNGCIINTVTQVTDQPKRVMIAVNHANYTDEMIKKTGVFNVSILTTETPFRVFEHFGFQSGRDADKFADCESENRAENGVLYIPKFTNAYISCKVVSMEDYGSHTVYIADVTAAENLSNAPSVTYQYYFDNIKPKPSPAAEEKKGFVCKICGYVYEGDTLPDDFICPLCKHGAEDFERL